MLLAPRSRTTAKPRLYATACLLSVVLAAIGCGDTAGRKPTGAAEGGSDGGPEPCAAGEELVEGQCEPIQTSCELLDCAERGRVCDEDPTPACGICASDRGYFEDSEGDCRLASGACESGSDCADGEYCQKLDTDPTRPPSCSLPPACVVLEADGNEPAMAWDPAEQDCIACPSCDDIEGATGRIWPVTASGACVCETSDGYYYDAAVSTRGPRACDADGDGWVESPARDAIESSDAAVRQNAHCHVRSVVSFTLQNERGERLDVSLTELGVGADSLELFEPRVLDSQSDFDAAVDRTPAYGERRFQPNQLNPLTKACVAPRADYNQDGLFDIEQRQSQSPSGDDAWLTPFVKLAYFVELNQGYYSPGLEQDGPGSYVIAEKRRCDAEQFPLSYGDTTASSYWRECERRRARDFDGSAPWSDFGRFTCQAGDGACPVVGSAELFARADLDPLTLIPLHASCSAEPSEGFTGMHHSSQFRCVQFQGSVSTPYGVELGQVYEPGETSPSSYVANVCAVAQGEIAIEASDDAVEAPLTCATKAQSDLASGDVGWSLAQFQPYAESRDYLRGCMGEGAEWPDLCPGEVTPGSRAHSNAFDFGNLYCGCGREFGGESCEVACAPGVASDSHLHMGGLPKQEWAPDDQALFSCDANGYCSNVICQPGDASCKPGRAGYWMCASLAASTISTAPETGGQWTLRGAHIPYSAIDHNTPLCDATTNDCATGYSLR